MKKIILTLSFFVLCLTAAFAQPANDVCSGATSVTANNTCYAGTTAAANDNWIGTVGCQSGNHVEVWYSFTATQSELDINVTAGTMGGNVEFILVSSTAACTGLTLAGSLCGASPLTGSVYGLQPGTTYYYTISSSGATGTFTTCVNNIAPVPVAGQDCNSAAILCDDSPFSQAASTAGFGTQEVTTTNSCWGAGGERQSKWFKFTAGKTGTLEFRILPNVVSNDYDWAIWDITGDPTGCTTKGNSIACNWSGCPGSTGISSCIASETSANNCTGPGDECMSGSSPRAWGNWGAGALGCITSTFSVTCGNSYALLVDNYTTSNNGFTLTWGGACNGGTAIIGPDPTFTVSSTLCGKNVTATKTGCTSATFTYSWNFGDGFTTTGAGPISHTYAAAGSYVISLTVTDPLGCSKVYSQTVSGSNVTSTTSQTNVLCNGGSTGAATVTPTSGTASYTYTWSPSGGNSATASGLGAGTYTVSITDAGGCTGTNTVTISQPATPLSATQAQTDLACNAVCGGSATVTPSGGTGAYTYSWTPSGGSSATASSLCAGTYTCTIKDANLCSITKTFTVTQPSAIAPVASQTATCSGTCNGSAAVSVSGGTGGYTYTWSPSGGNAATASSLCVGNYTATIKDGNNCTVTSTVAVASIALPTVTVNSPTVCAGSSVNLTAGGATSYTWNTGSSANPLSVTPGATSYTVTGTSAAGCTNTAVSTVTVVALPTVTVNSPTVCAGSSVNLTAGGASTYTWNTGSSANPLSVTPGATSYTVTGTSAAGCTNTAVSTVTVVALPTVTVNSPTVCAGSSVNLTAGGASTYTWNTGSSANPLSVTPGATSYTVTGTSAAGCTNTAVSTVTVVALPTVTVNSPSVCAGASVNLTANGASTYTWNTGSSANPLSVTPGATSYTVTGTSAAGCTNTAVSTVTVVSPPTVTVNSPTVCAGSSVNLTAGGASTYTWNTGSSANPLSVTPGATSYTVTGTSAAGCTNTAVSTVTVVALPNVTVNSPTVCSGSSVNLTANGASTYTWNTGSSANPLSVTPGATSYTVTGTSAAGCTNTAVSTVTVNPTPTVTVNSPTYCSGGNATLNASGGTTYSWAPSTGLSATTGSSVNANPTSTTVYTVTGTSTGCSGTNTATVTVNPTPTLSVNNPTICPGATVALNASGATSYSWHPGTNLSSTTGASVVANPTTTTSYTLIGTTGSCTDSIALTVTVASSLSVTVNSATICNGASTTLTALGAGTYTWSPATGLSSTSGASVTANPTITTTYTITGSSGSCSATATSTVTVNPSPTSSATASPTVICNGSSSTLSASGATTYTWSTGSSATSITVTPTSNTTYTLVGAIGSCKDSVTVTVNVNALPTLTVIPAPATICAGQSSTLTVSGASTYTWGANAGNMIANTVSVTPASTDTYVVTGTDANGCVNTNSVVVNVNALPVVNAGPDQTVCSGSSVTVSGSGATTYTWNGGVTDGTPFTPATGSYTFTVNGTDGNGCSNSDSVYITVNPTPTLSVNNPTICPGSTVTLTASGATNYTWSPAGSLSSSTGTSVVASPTATTTYTLIGESNGCVDSTTATVTVASSLVASVNSATICTGSSTILTAGGAATYTWSPATGLSSTNGTSVTANPTVTTTYTVIGSAGTCSATATSTVTVNSLPTLTVSPATATICSGQTATITAIGATTYTWGTNAGSAISNSVSVSPVSNATYVVTGTDANGCVNSDSVTVNVNALPPVDAGTNQTICSGATVTLSGSGATTYTWNGGVTDGTPFTPTVGSHTYIVNGTDGNGCTNKDSVTVMVNATPTVSAGADQSVCAGSSVTLTGSGATTYTWNGGITDGTPFTPAVGSYTYIVNGTDANGCTNKDSAVVTVNPTPTVSAGADQSVCAGNPITLSGSGASTYTWSGGVTDGTPFTPVAGSYTFIVNGTDANGCTGKDSAYVTVYVLPPVNAGADQTVCEGASITLSASGATTYTWNGGVADGTPFTPATGSYTFTVNGTDANGCTNKDSVYVTINPTPTVSAGADQTVCAGTAVTLSGGGATTYTWNGGITDGAPFTPAIGSYTYTVNGTDANGCTGKDSVYVTVNATPTVSAGPMIIMPCGGLTDTLSSSTNAVNPSYNWAGPGIVSGGTTATPIVNTTGIYSLTVTDLTTGCSDTSSVVVITNTLSVGFTPDVTTGYSPLSVNFANTSVNASTFNWAFGNGSGATTTNAGTTYNSSGTYTVVLIGYNSTGCSDTATATIMVLDNSSITAPNVFTPNGDNINDVYFFSTVGIESLSADLFNRWGEKIGRINGVNDGWDGKTPKGVDASEGTYYYILKAKGFDGKNYELHGAFTLVK